MTFFQLVEQQEQQVRRSVPMAPNSAFFLNPALLKERKPEPAPKRETKSKTKHPHLRLVYSAT